jgi:hypothetical protein
MSDANPSPPLQPGPTIHIADEFGTAKRNLPPVKTLVLALAAVLIVAGIVVLFQRAQPPASGSLDNVAAVEIPGQTAVLVAFTFTVHNAPDKPLWIKGIHAHLVTPSGESTADALSAIDFERYYRAFPALKANSEPALSPEDKLQPTQEIKRTVLASFPVSIEAFNQRRSVSLIIQPYDQPLPLVLAK